MHYKQSNKDKKNYRLFLKNYMSQKIIKLQIRGRKIKEKNKPPILITAKLSSNNFKRNKGNQITSSKTPCGRLNNSAPVMPTS